jgi:hypothetical protein
MAVFEEQLALGEVSHQWGSMSIKVQIESDRTVTALHSHQPKAEQWLRNFVTSAIHFNP